MIIYLMISIRKLDPSIINGAPFTHDVLDVTTLSLHSHVAFLYELNANSVNYEYLHKPVINNLVDPMRLLKSHMEISELIL